MPSPSPQWPLTLYYDGACPLCVREINLFRRRNQAGRLQLVDISQAEAMPLPGISRARMLACLHACFADQHLVTGIDATYWSYRAVGLGWLVRPLRWAWARPLWQTGYRLFCLLRPGLARLIPMPSGQRCADNACSLPDSNRSSDRD